MIFIPPFNMGLSAIISLLAFVLLLGVLTYYLLKERKRLAQVLAIIFGARSLFSAYSLTDVSTFPGVPYLLPCLIITFYMLGRAGWNWRWYSEQTLHHRLKPSGTPAIKKSFALNLDKTDCAFLCNFYKINRPAWAGHRLWTQISGAGKYQIPRIGRTSPNRISISERKTGLPKHRIRSARSGSI